MQLNNAERVMSRIDRGKCSIVEFGLLQPDSPAYTWYNVLQLDIVCSSNLVYLVYYTAPVRKIDSVRTVC